MRSNPTALKSLISSIIFILMCVITVFLAFADYWPFVDLYGSFNVFEAGQRVEHIKANS